MNDKTSLVNSIQDDISSLLGLSDMSEQERQEFFETISSLVIEAAVLKFLVSLQLEQQQAFGLWLETYLETGDLFQEAQRTYPLFAEILMEEMQTFQAETKKLLSVEK